MFMKYNDDVMQLMSNDLLIIGLEILKVLVGWKNFRAESFSPL